MKYELSLELLDSAAINKPWMNRLFGVDSADDSYVRIGDEAAEAAVSLLHATYKSPEWCEYHQQYHSRTRCLKTV